MNVTTASLGIPDDVVASVCMAVALALCLVTEVVIPVVFSFADVMMLDGDGL